MNENRVNRPSSGYADPQMADGDAGATVQQEYPQFVITDADRKRWDNAGVVTRELLAGDATDEAVWQMQRTIFHDRTSYPD